MSCILEYPRDTLRYKYFVKESNTHQAKMELRTFKWIVEKYTKPGDTILDPMSGVGTVHFANFMGRPSIAVELVPDFVQLQRDNIEFMMQRWIKGDFYDDFDDWDYKIDAAWRPSQHLILEGDNRRHLPLNNSISYPGFNTIVPDAVIFSPPYGSLWAFNKTSRDSKIAQEKNYVVGYDDSDANIGNLTNYTQYLTAMSIVYQKCFDSLKSGGVLVTVVKDYIHAGKRVFCSKDNLLKCMAAGFVFEDWHYRRADVQNNPFSAGNKKKRIAAGKHRDELDIGLEDIIVVRKP